MSSRRDGKYIGNAPLFSNKSLDTNLSGTWNLDIVNNKNDQGDWIDNRYQIESASCVRMSPMLGESGEQEVVRSYQFRPDGLKLYNQDRYNIYQFTVGTAWDPSTTVPDFVTLDTRNELFNATGLFFKTDGLKLYVCGNAMAHYGGQQAVFQYNLSTAWDISTATFSGQYYDVQTNGAVTNVQDIFMRADALRYYVVDYDSDRVVEYSVSSGNVGTSASTGITTTISTSENAPVSLFFRPDGRKMYIAGHQGVDITEFDLLSAWDLRTAVGVTTTFSIGDYPQTISFKPDGTKMFVGDNTYGGRLREYITDSKPWVVGIASTTQRLHNPAGIIFDLKFKPDGTRVFCTMQNKRAVFSADLDTPWNINSLNGSTVKYFTGLTTAFPSETEPRGVCFNSDGTRMYINGTATDTLYQYNLGIAWNIGTGVSFSTSRNYLWGSGGWDGRSCKFSEDGFKFYVAETVSDNILQFGLTTSFSVLSMKYEGKALNADLNYEEGSISAFDIDPSGKTIILGGQDRGATLQHNLVRNWDISNTIPAYTVTNQQNKYGSNVSGLTKGRYGFTFKPDGTKLYVAAQEAVIEHNLTDPWNLSTVYATNESFSTYETNSSIIDIRFKPDGTSMYIVDNLFSTVGQYDLEIPWKVRSAGFVTSYLFRNFDNDIRDVEFRPDGTKMFILGNQNNRVYELNLGTAWRVGTATTVRDYNVTSFDSNPAAMTFNDDGTRMYVSGFDSDRIQTYNLSSAWSLATVGVGTSFGNYTSNFNTYQYTSDAMSLYFKPDGTEFFFSTDDLFLLRCSTTSPFEIQRGRYVGFQTGLYSLFENGQANVTGLAYGDSGKRLYVSGYQYNRIQEFQL